MSRMVLDAEDKLDEAKYFLGLMQENIQDPKKFRYNLSAFLSAARSVMYVLRAQLARKSGFRPWHDAKERELKQNRYTKLLRDKRKYTIHMKLIDARRNIIIQPPPATMRVSASPPVVVIEQNGKEIMKEVISGEPETQPKKLEPIEGKVTERWFFKECPEVDVPTLCSEYLSILSEIVSEAKPRFPV